MTGNSLRENNLMHTAPTMMFHLNRVTTSIAFEHVEHSNIALN